MEGFRGKIPNFVCNKFPKAAHSMSVFAVSGCPHSIRLESRRTVRRIGLAIYSVDPRVFRVFHAAASIIFVVICECLGKCLFRLIESRVCERFRMISDDLECLGVIWGEFRSESEVS